MNKIKKRILTQLEHSKRGLFTKELSHQLNMSGSKNFKALVQAIAELEREEALEIKTNGRLALPQKKQLVTGILEINQRGFGFLRCDDDRDDIYIKKNHLHSAMPHDHVTVALTNESPKGSKKLAEGKVVEVNERAKGRLTGEFVPQTKEASREIIGHLKILDERLAHLNCEVLGEGLHPAPGEIVVAEVKQYPKAQAPLTMQVLVKKIIGHKDEPGVDILTILEAFNIPHEFSEKVRTEAQNLPDTLPAQELAERADFRDKLTITIDGADAKDLDDAIALEKLPNGHVELGVHIADVSYYVREGMALNQEAYRRGTSVYLTDRVVPMLPPRLSNNLCSLHPDVDRFTMSCVMEMDAHGDVVAFRIEPGVIRSNYRLTYQEVNELFAEPDEVRAEHLLNVRPMLLEMKELHEALTKKRRQRGMIDFDTDEAKIEVNEAGHPVDIHLVHRGIGERMIESFMLAANETVAKYFEEQKKAFIYRVHEEPDEEKIQAFLTYITAMGLTGYGTSEHISPKALQHILEQAEAEPFAPVVKMMLLRSMQQAHYDITPLGHFGLASRHYTHFTSPIRRYPDLIVHRLIRHYQFHGQAQETLADLPEIADHSSKMERRSVEAEREVDSLKKTEFMQDKVGEEFTGIISSVTSFGLFVELPNTIEGLISLTHLDDYYNFIEDHLILVGQQTGQVFRIGDEVRVKCVRADVSTREIDFELLEVTKTQSGDTPAQKPKKSTKKKKHQQKKRSKKRKGKRKPKKQPSFQIKKNRRGRNGKKK